MKQLFQFQNLGKRFLLPVVVFTISLAASAQNYSQTPLIQSREVELLKAYTEVEVIGDVTIILTNNLEGKILFRGDPKEVEAAKAIIKNRKLIIHAHRKRSRNKFTVYLPVSTISSLITSGKTEVLSSGTIKTPNLEILLNGSSFVSVRYDGKLNVVPGTGYDLIERRNSLQR
jgi:putative autotransporter adhesin-like protein